MKKVDWYFDFISPFAYLQFSQFKKFENELNITIHPVVFGVPTFVVDGQVFWGGDASDMMLDFIKNPKLFSSEEMKRISSMPMGLVRNKS